MKHKKHLAILIAAAIFLCAAPEFGMAISSNAEETTQERYFTVGNGSFYYINHGDHIEVTKFIGGNVVCIPEEIDGIPITVIADGAFCRAENTCSFLFESVIWPATVTTIPENAFQNCKRLRTVILPETLELIESNAFDGCIDLRDVFYKGDDAEWDEIFIESGNISLKDAYMHTNYNRSDRSDHTFSIEEDTWSFTNNDLEGYLMSEETLSEYLADCHPKTLASHITYYKAAVAPYEDKIAPYNYRGACSGFALTSYLVSVGVLKPSDIYKGAETLHEISLCEEAVKAICYYWAFYAFEDLIMAQSGCDLDIEYWESGRFREDMEQGKAVIISYMVKQGAHTVIAYGIEDGQWQYNDNTYSLRLLTYDNNRLGLVDEACIYFNGDFEDMYIPYLDSEAGLTDFLYEPDRFPYGLGNRTAYQPTYALGDMNKDDTVNASDAANILIAAANVGAGNKSGLNNGQIYAADVNRDGIFNAADAAKVLMYAAYAGSGGELSFEEYLS